MKKRINITLEYETIKKCQTCGINNLSRLINKLLDNHIGKIESLIDVLVSEKGYNEKDISDLLNTINL